MPIREYLNGENFDRETTRVMGVALEMACVALQLRDRSDPATTAMVAEKIIALAKAGERCATALCERALSELGCPAVSVSSPAAAPPASYEEMPLFGGTRAEPSPPARLDSTTREPGFSPRVNRFSIPKWHNGTTSASARRFLSAGLAAKELLHEREYRYGPCAGRSTV